MFNELKPIPLQKGFLLQKRAGQKLSFELTSHLNYTLKKNCRGKKEELVQATDPSSSKFKYETKLVNLRRYVIFCNFPWAHHTI